MTIKTRRLANALGAAVLDVDLSQPMEPATFRAIRKAWVEHLVLVFPGQQDLTPEQHVAFSRLFGELDRNEATPSYRLSGYEEVIAITNRPASDGKPSPSKDVGRKWHSDLDFTLRPTMGSLLWCGQLPEVGGDTMFANMYQALETLSPGLRRTLEGLEAVYDVMAGVRAEDGRDAAALDEMRANSRSVAQPVVRVHPESGRASLFLSERAVRFEGWTEEESRPLIEHLCRHATQPERVFRKQWQPGDLVIWDNRCTVHQALADYDRSQIRYMRRTAVLGEPSGRLVQE
ncbi:TauD/TfdA dioxygenase family protein [Xenophilus azovorans]|uniref:TauD/TfdA dioxygenase family protein n=1 Tax=Xenophilus azovorans TaxID=151755 RepID=UPI0005711C7C|nr:TauD/TfdA family dioxygenase [Xenophilus azovorans]